MRLIKGVVSGSKLGEEEGVSASERKRKRDDKHSLEGTESEGQGEKAKSGKTGSLNVVVRFDGEG